MLAAYSDNIYIATASAQTVVPRVLEIVDRTHGPQAGYQRGSTTLCMPRLVDAEAGEEDAMDIGWHPSHSDLVPVRAFVALGVPVGPPVFVKEYLDAKLNKLEALFTAIDGLDDAQVQLYLITRSMSICRVTHLMRCLPPTPELTAFITSYSNVLRLWLRCCARREWCSRHLSEEKRGD